MPPSGVVLTLTGLKMLGTSSWCEVRPRRTPSAAASTTCVATAPITPFACQGITASQRTAQPDGPPYCIGKQQAPKRGRANHRPPESCHTVATATRAEQTDLSPTTLMDTAIRTRLHRRCVAPRTSTRLPEPDSFTAGTVTTASVSAGCRQKATLTLANDQRTPVLTDDPTPASCRSPASRLLTIHRGRRTASARCTAPASG